MGRFALPPDIDVNVSVNYPVLMKNSPLDPGLINLPDAFRVRTH